MAATAPTRGRGRLAATPVVHAGAGRWIAYIGIGIGVIFFLFPVYWMVLSAIQPARLSMRFPPPFWPQVINLTPFEQLFSDYPVVTWVTNSTIISLLSTALCLGLGVFGAYALSCLRWRGRMTFAKRSRLCSMSRTERSRTGAGQR